MTIRCQAFASQNEPGGVKYFSTKADTEFNEVAWTVGSGELSPALEEGMMGMRRNGLRRIIIPSTAVFAARDNNQLPLPTTKDGKRIFDRLFKTDATLLVEILVTSVKNPPPPKVEEEKSAPDTSSSLTQTEGATPTLEAS